MKKQELVEVSEKLSEMPEEATEIGTLSPIVFLILSVLILVINILILYKLHYQPHSHRSNNEFRAIVYYFFECVNFVVSFFIIEYLIKKIKKGSNNIVVYLSIILSVLNPFIYAFLFY